MDHASYRRCETVECRYSSGVLLLASRTAAATSIHDDIDTHRITDNDASLKKNGGKVYGILRVQLHLVSASYRVHLSTPGFGQFLHGSEIKRKTSYVNSVV